jgi:hypothetical protein
VDFVRLLIVLLFAAAGYTIATHLSPSTPWRTAGRRALDLHGVRVWGRVLGRQTAVAVRSMEEELRKVPAA